VSHDPSEIILLLKKNDQCLKQLCCLIVLLKLRFPGFLDNLNIIGNVISVFILTFDQCNASLLNESLNFFEKNDPKLCLIVIHSHDFLKE